jgi:hypothetical protein
MAAHLLRLHHQSFRVDTRFSRKFDSPDKRKLCSREALSGLQLSGGHRMLRKRFGLVLVVLLCFIAFTPTALFSQAANTGSVAGTVTDQQGAAVAAAGVTLTDKATSIARTSSTNENGRYIFVDVPPGTYNVSVVKTGFRTARLAEQVVSVGVGLTLNIVLTIGDVAETVEVTATTGAELQTLNATVGNTIGGEVLANLPTIQRDAATFVTLQPGVSPNGSVAGAVVDQSSFMLDGGQNSSDMDGSQQVYTPSFAGDPTGGIVARMIGGSPTGVMPTPLDSVEEYKVNTANQTADFNSSAGAEVQVVTKRGTNSWHGTAYEYYLDNGLNANTFNNNFNHVKLPSYHYNRFGAAGGGPIIPKDFLGGKTYFFANFERFVWNNSSTYEAAVPSANMRQGILTFNGVNYNLNTGSNCGASGSLACDPRGLGIDPLVSQLWNKYEPMPNDPTCGALSGPRCDGVNEQGFLANVSVPQTSNFGVARLDHDFGSKWHFSSSYRYYRLNLATTSQIDIGGFFPGDTLGTPASLSNRPQQPWYYVAGLTTNITPNTTNDLHFSYLRNYWAWNAVGGSPQFSQLGGALEPFGEFSTTSLTPYNVNTQNVRTRFWDGEDKFLRDDMTMLKGNHLFTWGGAYQRNWDYHQRSDNGGGINYTPSYLLGDSAGGGLVDFSSTNPAGVNPTIWARDSAAILGIVTDSQIAYTRSGSNLALNPPLTHAFDQSTIPYYNVYFSDSWHLKPSITLTYGLGWTLEMPPTEAQGKQIELTDASGQLLDLAAYLNQRQAAALQGQVYNPEIGFALVGNTANGLKYPYNPYYGSFSPRVALAWNPNYTDGLLGSLFGGNKTVVRGGYSRVYGRLNGVDLVLVPLLGDGLIQAVQCRANNMNGTCVAPAGGLTLANAFRIGTDGNNAPIPAASPTLPQPTFPGYNAVAAGAAESLDPNFRPNVVDSFDLTLQRQLTPKILLEVGYIGRRITHEYQPVNINAVPYMMTLGGQQFAKAYAAVETAIGCATSFAACGANVPAKTLSGGVPNPAYTAFFNALPVQPFFQAAMKPAFCSGSYAGVAFTSCTAAVAFNQISNFKTQSVWSLWSALDNGDFNFPTSMENTPIAGSPFGAQGQTTSGVGVNASIGHGNYNGAFVSLRTNNWHNITFQENFTYSKALGTGALTQSTSEYTVNDPWNLNNMYGLQQFDRKFVFNTYAEIDEPWYKGQQGLVGRVLGGWSLSPIFTAGSGAPLACTDNTSGQSFGSGDGASFFDNENCIAATAPSGGSASLTSSGPGKFNMFANPTAVFNSVRAPILGLDTGTGGVGIFRGLPYWNMDVRVVKDIHLMERYGLQFEFVATNVFNHPVFVDPTLNATSPTTFGQTSAQGNLPRAMQFGLRFQF